MGGDGSSGIVEVGRDLYRQQEGRSQRRGYRHKHAVLSLVERGGQVRSVHVPDVKAATVVPIVNANISKEARVMTDDASILTSKLEGFADARSRQPRADEYVARGRRSHEHC